MPPAEPADPWGDLAALAAQTASLVRWCRRYRLLAGTGDATVRPRPIVTVPQPVVVSGPAGGTDSLEAVAAEVAACRRCHLGATRRNAVPGEGAAPAALMVIGEGPGATEDATGRPFVGEAGQMLTRMLENVLKLPRRQVFIANIVKCRPPNNREPAPDEAEACASFLRRQVALVRPRAILCLGKIAAHHLLGVTTPISVLRGTRKSWNGVTVFPTFHPAYLLRNSEMKPKVMEDLLAVKAYLEEADVS